MAAIRQARRAIDDIGKRGEITLVYAGGIRNGGDVAKAIALGADAIAIGHSAMMVPTLVGGRIIIVGGSMIVCFLVVAVDVPKVLSRVPNHN